jgi:hypothetical protein
MNAILSPESRVVHRSPSRNYCRSRWLYREEIERRAQEGEDITYKPTLLARTNCSYRPYAGLNRLLLGNETGFKTLYVSHGFVDLPFSPT